MIPIIKRASIEDIEKIYFMVDEFRQVYGETSDLESCKDFVTERISKNESVIFFACDSVTLTPFGYVQLYPFFSTLSLRTFWMLTDLYIRPDFRKNGYSKLLINNSKVLAQESKTVGILIEARITNHSAERLYDTVGFKKEGEHLYYYLEN